MLDEVLAAAGLTRDALGTAPGSGQLPGMQVDSIERTAELERVLALPERAPMSEDDRARASKALRKPGTTGELFAPQALGLRELANGPGLFAPMKVGAGKTLLSLLAATVTGAHRPVLVVPAALRDKTYREFSELLPQWHVRLPKILSYTEIGRPDRADALVREAPDLLILDEAHKARNLYAACTRRIGRAISLFAPKVAVLSGTLITHRLMDYWHLLLWSLREQAPVPLTAAEAGRWAEAIDSPDRMGVTCDLGALREIPGGFHAYMRSRAGVVPTPGSDCDAKIVMHAWSPKLPPDLKDLIAEVGTTRTRPDGQLLEDMEVSDCLCQLACGFWYRWNPEPPAEWMAPRAKWNAYLRWVLEKMLPDFDSPTQIVNALDRGGPVLPPLPTEGEELLAAWRAVRDTFTPTTEPVWIDDAPMRAAAAAPQTLIWVKYRAAGHKLAELGVPYYGGGTDPQTATPGTTIALSIQAHGTGRNMQAWSRSLVLTPPANADAWEQMIGRTHRRGQECDTVDVMVYTVINYHDRVVDRVLNDAEAIGDASGFESKLQIAQWA